VLGTAPWLVAAHWSPNRLLASQFSWRSQLGSIWSDSMENRYLYAIYIYIIIYICNLRWSLVALINPHWLLVISPCSSALAGTEDASASGPAEVVTWMGFNGTISSTLMSDGFNLESRPPSVVELWKLWFRHVWILFFCVFSSSRMESTNMYNVWVISFWWWNLWSVPCVLLSAAFVIIEGGSLERHLGEGHFPTAAVKGFWFEV
jgi:hypothetical protein